MFENDSSSGLEIPEQYQEVWCRLEMIDKATAREYLSHNVDNRVATKTALAKLNHELSETGWRLTPDCAAFDIYGKLINGQHRLRMIAETDITRDGPVPMLVVRGMPPESWYSTDRGKPRSLADALTRNGHVRSSTLAAMLRLLWVYEQTRDMPHNAGGRGYTEGTLLRFLEARKGIVRWSRQESVHDIPAASIGVIGYCIQEAYGREEAETFFSLLKKPAGLHEHDPIFQLYTRLNLAIQARRGVNVRALPGGRRHLDLDLYERRALTIVAFNKWIRGETVQSLRWQRGGTHRQAFPLIYGYPYFVQRERGR